MKPSPERRLDVVVTDLFRIKGRGTMAVATIGEGYLQVGDLVELVRPDGMRRPARVRSIDIHSQPGEVAFLLDPDADDFLVAGTRVRIAG